MRGGARCRLPRLNRVARDACRALRLGGEKAACDRGYPGVGSAPTRGVRGSLCVAGTAPPAAPAVASLLLHVAAPVEYVGLMVNPMPVIVTNPPPYVLGAIVNACAVLAAAGIGACFAYILWRRGKLTELQVELLKRVADYFHQMLLASLAEPDSASLQRVGALTHRMVELAPQVRVFFSSRANAAAAELERLLAHPPRVPAEVELVGPFLDDVRNTTDRLLRGMLCEAGLTPRCGRWCRCRCWKKPAGRLGRA